MLIYLFCNAAAFSQDGATPANKTTQDVLVTRVELTRLDFNVGALGALSSSQKTPPEIRLKMKERH